MDNRLLSKSQLVEYNKLPDLELMRGELVTILGTAAGGRTSSLLGSPQQTLSTNLSQYVKQCQEGQVKDNKPTDSAT